jgi:hypothetical protein
VGIGEVGDVLRFPNRGLATSLDPGRSAALALVGAGGGLHVGIESPVFTYRAGAVARAVLSCALVAGSVHGSCIRGGAEKVVAVAPEEWRKWLCGKRSPSDKEIKAALQRHVELPRCNVHERDALGVALWLRAGGRSTLLPWLHWESGAGWPSATSATASSTRTRSPRKSGFAKR